MIDKFKTCKDCPDRSIMPNCHSTCEGYLARCKQNEERRKQCYQNKSIEIGITESICRKIKRNKNKGRI